METLRTPYQLTEEMQRYFYDEVICNPDSPHRYWSIWHERNSVENQFFGFGGITNIQWENRLAEISLIVNPAVKRQGYGEKAVDLLLDKAFNYMNLQTVCGECYYCNSSGIDFWMKIIKKYTPEFENGITLPNRKYWNGELFDSLYFSIDRGDYAK